MDDLPNETLNPGLGSAVAHVPLQLGLQVLNLHQLARHIVEHPGRFDWRLGRTLASPT